MKRILFTIVLTLTLHPAYASETRPSWLRIGYAKTTAFLSATTWRTEKFLSTLAGYFPPIARKRTFEQRIAQVDKIILTLDQQEKDSIAYFEKIDRLAKKNVSPSTETFADTGDDNYESSSLVFNMAGPSDLPTSALQQSPAKQLHRRLTSRQSLRDLITKIKKENPEELPSSMHLSPGLIKAALIYLGECLDESESLYRNHTIKPFTHITCTGIDEETGEFVSSDNFDYEKLCGTRNLDHNDIRLINGWQTLNVSLERYNSAEIFFKCHPETEGYRLYKLLQSPEEMAKQGLDPAAVHTAYEEHKKNITFFDINKTKDYCNDDHHSTLVNEYVAQTQMFMKENQDFRKGFKDDKGITHEGWLAILARDKAALKQQKEQSAKRWYL